MAKESEPSYRCDYGVYGWRGTLRITFSVIGILAALSAIMCFSVAFKNLNCVIWGAVSGVLSCVTLAMHIMVWKDVESKTKVRTFTQLSLFGLIGFISGCAGSVTYLYLGINSHESGVQLHGYFIACVWTGMTIKWGLVLFFYARMYRKRLIRLFGGVLNGPMI